MRLLSTICVGLALSVGMWSAPAHAVVIDYTSFFGTLETPSFTDSGVTVTAGLSGGGAANVRLNSSSLGGIADGLSAVGDGTLDIAVDGTEFLDFAFALPALNVAYEPGAIGNADLDGLFGERQLDVFAPGGALLGSFLQDGTGGFFDISSLVANAAIGGFRLTALDGDDFSVETLTLTPVPLPAAAWLLLTALSGMGLLGWRRKRTAAA